MCKPGFSLILLRREIFKEVEKSEEIEKLLLRSETELSLFDLVEVSAFFLD